MADRPAVETGVSVMRIWPQPWPDREVSSQGSDGGQQTTWDNTLPRQAPQPAFNDACSPHPHRMRHWQCFSLALDQKGGRNTALGLPATDQEDESMLGGATMTALTWGKQEDGLGILLRKQNVRAGVSGTAQGPRETATQLSVAGPTMCHREPQPREIREMHSRQGELPVNQAESSPPDDPSSRAQIRGSRVSIPDGLRHLSLYPHPAFANRSRQRPPSARLRDHRSSAGSTGR